MRTLVLMALLFTTGCADMIGRAIVHPHSSVTAPTFCLYKEPVDKDEPKRSQESEILAIERLEVFYGELPKEEVWVIHYVPDPLYEDLKPVSCVTYGKLPPGYKEKAPAPPLIAERRYSVRLRSIQDHGAWSGNYNYRGVIDFDIRVDANGQSARLEYIDDRYSGAIKTMRRR